MDLPSKKLYLGAKSILDFRNLFETNMEYCCYILYSKSINRFYIGYTSDIVERIKLHNSGSFGRKSYTHCASDWKLFFMVSCDTIEQAMYIESKIKKMKSRKYNENLRKYPEIADKILKESSE